MAHALIFVKRKLVPRQGNEALNPLPPSFRNPEYVYGLSREKINHFESLLIKVSRFARDNKSRILRKGGKVQPLIRGIREILLIA